MFLKCALFGAGLFLIIYDATGVSKDYTCSTLKLKFGRVRYRQKGRLVKFVCNTGYLIAGEKYSTCNNGVWDSPVPKCVRTTCNKVSPPINGLIYPSHRGGVLNFFCKPGYEILGANTTYCDGRYWDNKLPTCIASNTKPSLSCDFENEDLCGWNHDLQHDFDWKRMNFKTPSGHLGTGPSFDHTKGEGQNGYYMYIESSSRNENDTARLISPIFNKIDDSDVCLEFFYHMHGSTTGQLRVYLKKESDNWLLEPMNALFWKMGNHGDRWLRSLTHIGPINEDFQIIIEGVRGTSYFSDIAIDDVSIKSNCTIEIEETTTNDIIYTDDYQPYQSCLNRCDEDNLIVRPVDPLNGGCDCDEMCRANNTCCPDYVAVCILGVTDYEPSVTTEDMETNRTSFNSTSINATVASVNNTETTTWISSSAKPRPKLVFLTPTTSQVIIRKTKPTELTTPMTKVYFPYNSTVKDVKTTAFDDVLTLPPPAANEEDVIYTVKNPITGVHLDLKPQHAETAPLGFKTPNGEGTGSSFNSNILVTVVIVSVLSVLFVILIVSLLVKRSRYFNCHSLRRSNSSSNSQSDVRFLTSDEILDFNLAQPDH